MLKPVGPERLRDALRLARTLTGFERDSGRIRPIGPERRRQITAWYRGEIQSVLIEQVMYLRADQKYVTVRHPDGELLVEESLRSFEQEFPDLFLRIHRNALVARSRLSGLERLPDGSTMARLIDCDDRLLVSRRHLPLIRHWLRGAEGIENGHQPRDSAGPSSRTFAPGERIETGQETRDAAGPPAR